MLRYFYNDEYNFLLKTYYVNRVLSNDIIPPRKFFPRILDSCWRRRGLIDSRPTTRQPQSIKRRYTRLCTQLCTSNRVQSPAEKSTSPGEREDPSRLPGIRAREHRLLARNGERSDSTVRVYIYRAERDKSREV